jgi:hypothetical protein
MEKKLSLQKETIHRLGGSSLPSAPERDGSRGANNNGMNVESSIFLSTLLTLVS